jgi:hypothetical protein
MDMVITLTCGSEVKCSEVERISVDKNNLTATGISH